jgi:hypothetical protein
MALVVLPTDDSDLDWRTRSELRVHTDYRTGCQYFSGLLGGVTPRLDRDGRQICDGQRRP